MLIGEQGSAKTTLINAFLKKFKSDDHVVINSNFSSTTTPQLFKRASRVLLTKEWEVFLVLQLAKR